MNLLPVMGADRQPAQQVFGAELRHQKGPRRAVQRREEQQSAGLDEPRRGRQEGRRVRRRARSPPAPLRPGTCAPSASRSSATPVAVGRWPDPGRSACARAAASASPAASSPSTSKPLPGQRLGRQAGAAADIQQSQSLQRRRCLRRGPRGDPADARRVHPVQRPHRPVRVPPARRQRVEARDLLGARPNPRAVSPKLPCMRCPPFLRPVCVPRLL